MNNKKQQLLISYLISSSDTFAICQGIVQPDYFDPEYRNSVRFIKEYYEEYNTTPNLDQIEAETGNKFEYKDIKRDQIDYTTTEIEKFCRRRAIEKAVLASPKLIEKGDYGTLENSIKDAVMVSLQHNLGLRYFDDPEERLRRMMEDSPVQSTGWNEVDEKLFGGISRKELLLVSANSGGGKSITLANLAVNFAEHGLNVLYISLELSEDIVAQRFDTMFTGVGRKDWKSHVNEITTTLSLQRDKCGVIDIIQMQSGTKATQIKAYLKEYYLHYDMMPDLLVLDYLDKMSPNEQVNASDVWTKDKLISEQLRDIGVEYNMFIATASQLNREAVKATSHDHSHIAGGISKINESDVYWSIVMTEAMKAQGQIAFTFQKTRNSDGVGSTIYLKWNGHNLRITDQDKETLTLKKSNSAIKFDDNDATTSSGLMGMLDSL
jgi:KaiC/GvpD/RAD55 family RecA-like ATPase